LHQLRNGAAATSGWNSAAGRDATVSQPEQRGEQRRRPGRRRPDRSNCASHGGRIAHEVIGDLNSGTTRIRVGTGSNGSSRR
jgi:hypothetical protein